MKKYKWIIISAILLVLGFIVYKVVINRPKNILKPVTIPVTEGPLNTQVTATGTIQATELVEVGTQVSGIVSNLYVDYNSTVKKGELLAELDKENLNQTLTQAQSQYDVALTERNYQKTIYNRQKQLYDNELISLAEFQEAEFAYRNAQSAVEQRLAAVKTAETNLGYANIYSPIDGVVLSKDISEGQTVAASFSTPTLFTIAKDLSKMQVEADVDEADIGNVKVGQRVTFTVDAYPDEIFNGNVLQVRLNGTTTSNVVKYTCIIQTNNDEELLMPHMTATITIYTEEVENTLMVEAKAVNYTPDLEIVNNYLSENFPEAAPIDSIPVAKGKNQRIVWIIDEKGITPKQVTIGINDGVNAQIVEGVTSLDTVLIGFEEADAKRDQENKSIFAPRRKEGDNRRK
jgi:HlyD family secretion protein